jgi:tetratricopeptide (TPR) repeat protein
MKKTPVIICALFFWAIGACATAPRSTSPDSDADRGDRDLRRGIYWYHKGCSRKALDHFLAAHEYYCLTDQPVGVARSLLSLANLYRHLHGQESSLPFYDAAISAARRCGDQTVTAQALSNKAALLIDSDQLSAAEVLLDEAQLLSREAGPAFAMVLNHRAVLLMKEQQYDKAAILLSQADSAVGRGSHRVEATLHYTHGRLMMISGDYPQALTRFQQALELDRLAGFAQGMAADLAAIADIQERLGQDEAALDYLARSIRMYALIDKRKTVLENLERLETLAKRTGTDIGVTLHFINQWMAGETVDTTCR